VITHPRALKVPLPIDVALDDLKQILQSPSVRLLSETPRHAEIMDLLLRDTKVVGERLFDARIAALCIEHHVSQIITGDRDFTRFPLNARNPFSP